MAEIAGIYDPDSPRHPLTREQLRAAVEEAHRAERRRILALVLSEPVFSDSEKEFQKRLADRIEWDGTAR